MDKKDEFRARWQEQIDQLSVKIDELKAKAAEASAEVREEMAEQLHGLEGQREKARAKLNELLEAGEGVWDEVAEEAEELFGKIKKGFEGLMSKLGDSAEDDSQESS